MRDKKRVMITIPESGVGGPFVSHMRIMESSLSGKYEFVPLYTKRIRKMLTPGYLKYLKSLFEETRPDLIQCTGLQLDGFAVVFLCRIVNRKKCPVVVAVHGSSGESTAISLLRKKMTLALEKWTLRHSDVCFGVSKYVSSWSLVKKNAKRNFGYIYNLPQTPNAISREDIRNKFGFKKSDVVVVSTGRVNTEKGFDLLMKIIQMEKGNADIKFIIVGDGEYLPVIRHKVVSENLTNVYLTGQIKDVHEVLVAGDVFVICTLHETLCNSVLEAGKAGLPVIATNVGGIPEIVRDGETGLLFPPGDYIRANEYLKRLINNKEERVQMGAKLSEWVNTEFSEASILKKIDELYQTALCN